ncbi:hypothetical protein Rsub_00650 [Raphidocelis subcapitata]|uniref:Uncharacterized protein n=1 Tax=Raphidocelis subcapitata TaxID=307507 RepID=A0A2V0NKS7_9CHLO|nr:hypothetical protein Rsub_00650 [Raphidocelis subcapitata]|eukprot:GBF87938.1 hypothetical protein Rsub_00650 [Raphidocelis subcapitata]
MAALPPAVPGAPSARGLTGLETYQREANIMLDMLLHQPGALATLRLICEGAYKGPSDQASATQWLVTLRASLRAAAAAPPYCDEDDRSIMTRVSTSYRALWTKAAGGLSLAQAADVCLTTVLGWHRRHDLSRAIFGNAAASSLAGAQHPLHRLQFRPSYYEPAGTSHAWPLPPLDATAAGEGGLGLGLGDDACRRPLPRGGVFDDEWWKPNGSPPTNELAPLERPLGPPPADPAPLVPMLPPRPRPRPSACSDGDGVLRFGAPPRRTPGAAAALPAFDGSSEAGSSRAAAAAVALTVGGQPLPAVAPPVPRAAQGPSALFDLFSPADAELDALSPDQLQWPGRPPAGTPRRLETDSEAERLLALEPKPTDPEGMRSYAGAYLERAFPFAEPRHAAAARRGRGMASFGTIPGAAAHAEMPPACRGSDEEGDDAALEALEQFGFGGLGLGRHPAGGSAAAAGGGGFGGKRAAVDPPGAAAGAAADAAKTPGREGGRLPSPELPCNDSAPARPAVSLAEAAPSLPPPAVSPLPLPPPAPAAPPPPLPAPAASQQRMSPRGTPGRAERPRGAAALAANAAATRLSQQPPQPTNLPQQPVERRGQEAACNAAAPPDRAGFSPLAAAVDPAGASCGGAGGSTPPPIPRFNMQGPAAAAATAPQARAAVAAETLPRHQDPRWGSQRSAHAMQALLATAGADPAAAMQWLNTAMLNSTQALMHYEFGSVPLPPGLRAELASLPPREAAARAAAAASHPACPSQGVLCLLLGHALADGALAPLQVEADPKLAERKAAFLAALHCWWLAWWADVDAAAARDARDASLHGTDPELLPPRLRALSELLRWHAAVLASASPALLLRLAHHHLPGGTLLAEAFHRCPVALNAHREFRPLLEAAFAGDCASQVRALNGLVRVWAAVWNPTVLMTLPHRAAASCVAARIDSAILHGPAPALLRPKAAAEGTAAAQATAPAPAPAQAPAPAASPSYAAPAPPAAVPLALLQPPPPAPPPQLPQQPVWQLPIPGLPMLCSHPLPLVTTVYNGTTLQRAAPPPLPAASPPPEYFAQGGFAAWQLGLPMAAGPAECTPSPPARFEPPAAQYPAAGAAGAAGTRSAVAALAAVAAAAAEAAAASDAAARAEARAVLARGALHTAEAAAAAASPPAAAAAWAAPAPRVSPFKAFASLPLPQEQDPAAGPAGGGQQPRQADGEAVPTSAAPGAAAPGAGLPTPPLALMGSLAALEWLLNASMDLDQGDGSTTPAAEAPEQQQAQMQAAAVAEEETAAAAAPAQPAALAQPAAPADVESAAPPAVLRRRTAARRPPPVKVVKQEEGAATPPAGATPRSARRTPGAAAAAEAAPVRRSSRRTPIAPSAGWRRDFEWTVDGSDSRGGSEGEAPRSATRARVAAAAAATAAPALPPQTLRVRLPRTPSCSSPADSCAAPGLPTEGGGMAPPPPPPPPPRSVRASSTDSCLSKRLHEGDAATPSAAGGGKAKRSRRA